jgi:hypothetical protein
MRKTALIASATGVLLSLMAPFIFAAEPAAAEPAVKSASVRQIDWDELLPPVERERAATDTPAPIHDYLGGGMAAAQRGSYDVNPALNGANVKIPGFIVPLEMDANGRVREFFLVPYFGACIHVPPPPPNQIVYVRLGESVKMGSIYQAQWVTGTLRAEPKSSRLGAAAYTLNATSVEAYKY